MLKLLRCREGVEQGEVGWNLVAFRGKVLAAQGFEDGLSGGVEAKGEDGSGGLDVGQVRREWWVWRRDLPDAWARWGAKVH